MSVNRRKLLSKCHIVEGSGLLNSLINKLPIELHIPGYQYCGPGTKLEKRLKRGDPGINPLDSACKDHDIAYTKFQDIENRHRADKILEEKAWQRFLSKDANLSERASSLLVTNIMKGKIKFGMGIQSKQCKVKRSKSKSGKGFEARKSKAKKTIKIGTAIQHARKVLKLRKPKNTKESITIALAAAKEIINSRKNPIKTPRIIPIPKIGGVIPFLIPLFAGLSAAGALAGGVSGIAKAVNEAEQAKKQLTESKRHNETMESIAMGRGLYLKPFKSGLGLYLSPQSKNY